MGRFQEDYEKVCPYCGEQFTANRTNQKFCSNRCKYTFNNRQRKRRSLKKLEHQRILDRNYRVLETTHKSNKDSSKLYSREELIAKGFSFQFLTRSMKTNGGKEVIGIYNYVLCPEKEGYYTIHKAA